MVVIKDLFFESRFPSGWKVIPLLVYLPIGLALATMRIFIGVQAIIAASLLHKLSSFRSVVLRTMCAILGVVVFQENDEARDESVKVIATNHVSILDHLAVHLLTGSVSVSVDDLPPLFHFAFNYKSLGGVKNRDDLVHNVKRLVENGVVIDVQPEKAITSGETALLRFSTWPCTLSHPIQPAVIKIWRPPLMDVRPSVISASWMSDLFWFLFVPFTVFKIKYLPLIRPVEDESPEDMSKRLESSIAKDLNICTTAFTSADKAELEKRLEAEKFASSQVSGYAKSESRLMDMAWKVKEVLPDVPIKTICADLARTKNVDVTIANFLEGLVRYEPEKCPPPSRRHLNTGPPELKKSSLEVSQPSTSSVSDASLKTFPKSARDRMISFQERKLRLIETARQKYIEKHALNIMNSS